MYLSCVCTSSQKKSLCGNRGQKIKNLSTLYLFHPAMASLGQSCRLLRGHPRFPWGNCPLLTFPQMKVLSELSRLNAGQNVEQSPPVSNTGVTQNIPPTTHTLIDWIRGTFPIAHFDAIAYLIKDFFGEVPELVLGASGQPRGTHNFRYLYSTVSGVSIELSNYQKDEQSADQQGSLQVPGSVLSQLSPENLSDFLSLTAHYISRFTRFDIAVDDYSRTVSLDKVTDAARAGNLQGFRVWEPRTGFLKVGGGGQLEYQTINFGRRGKQGSGKFVRIYDKNIESQGKQNCIRIEAEFHKYRADEVARSFADSNVEDYPSLVMGWLKGALNFIDRSAAKNVCDCPMLDWWAKLFSRYDKISFRPRHVKRSFEKSLTWLETQVAPTFHMVTKCLGLQDPAEIFNFIDRMDENGRRKQNHHHRSIISAFQHQLDVMSMQPA